MSADPRVDVRPEPSPWPDLGVRFTRSRRAIPRRTGHPRRDRGALSLEMAILFPLVLTLTFGAVQVGLWFQARSMC